MPNLETLQVSAASQQIAREAHLLRTKDRIAQLKLLVASPHSARKEHPNAGEIQAEQDVIREEIEFLEVQLTDPRTRASIERDPTGAAKAAAPETPNPLTQLVLTLKQELADLKAALGGTKESHDAVPEPAAAAR